LVIVQCTVLVIVQCTVLVIVQCTVLVIVQCTVLVIVQYSPKWTANRIENAKFMSYDCAYTLYSIILYISQTC
jgi:hypothetical protein